MNQRRLPILGPLLLIVLGSVFGAARSDAQVKSASGMLAGVVKDISGTPQMGASVQLVPESMSARAADYLTNTQGVFRGEKLSPGLYTVRVTLAGFLPTLQQHVRISSHLTTVVRVELESIFASLDQLRRQPSATSVEADDWKWVLRSASVSRPVLQWMEEGDVATSQLDTRNLRPRARLDFTDGARRPGSASTIPSAPATAFAYDQSLGGSSRLILAGQMNYQDSAPGGALATVWLPTGSLSTGPHSALVLRESKLGPDGQTFRGVRVEQGGAIGLGQRSVLHYGAEYVMVGLSRAATSLRPHLQLETHISDDWHAALIFAAEPGAPTPLEADEHDSGGALAAALDELDSFPALLWRNGRPVLEGGWHEELNAERKLGAGGKLQIAAFHDDNRHVAVYGHGTDLPLGDYLQDYFSNQFAYDGGSSNSWGTRIALREKLSDDVELTALYAFAGALTPSQVADGALRDLFRTSMHHSVGVGVSAKVHRTGTKLDAGYKWISGTSVSRPDAYGDSLFQMDPFVHLGVRQALPKFAPGRWQAVADCDNVFAQGYVSLTSQDGHTVLVPAFRTFRGGVSVQF